MNNLKKELEDMVQSLESNNLGLLVKQSKEFHENVSWAHIEQMDKDHFEIQKENIKNGGSTAHSTHCCKKHGCKYGEDKYCTVIQDLEKQEISCPVSDYCEDQNEEDYSMHSNYTPY